MSKPLSVLMVEDSKRDAELLALALEAGGYELTTLRVDTREAMSAALDSQSWDIIISDYSMPQFSGLAALEVVRQRGLDVPFILASGTVGEDVAVAAMKAGAHDYLMKDNLTRLAPAVERELREFGERRLRRQAQSASRASEQRFRAMFDQAAVGVAQSDLDGRWLSVNQRLLDMYGYSWEELAQRRFLDITHADDVEADLTQYARLVAGEISSYSLEKRFICRDGSMLWANLTVSLVRDDDGQALYTMAVVEDISERKRGEDALRQSEARFRQMFERNQAIMLLLDPASGCIVDANPAACAFYGFPWSDLIRKTLTEITASPRSQNQKGMARVLRDERSSFLVAHRLASGDKRDVEVHASLVEAEGRTFIYAIIHDVTERTKAEGVLRHQALHDELTGLPNRTLLQDRLEQTTRRARRHHANLSLLLIDLDRFKEINDTFGHHVGDLLLQQLAARFDALVRQSDTVARPGAEVKPAIAVARLGGDEFAIVLPDTDGVGAVSVAERLTREFQRPFVVSGQALDIGASIGIALYPDHGNTAELLLQHADVAMYEAKRAHVGHALYDSTLDPYTPGRIALRGDLRRAIEQQELELYYQPKVDMRTGAVLGAEALVRWHHSEEGFIPPPQLIELAEHTDLIKPLTVWVLTTAVRQCRAWRNAGSSLTIAVNLSARSLHDHQLVQIVRELLEEAQLSPGALTLEITETAVMIDPQRASTIIEQLAAMGVKVSIDDFGTGYSSLSYLKELSAAEVKIDKSFLPETGQAEGDWRIVRAAIALAHDLGLQTVAEGIESQEIWEHLQELNCDVGQGYYHARPMPAACFAQWLANVPGTLKPASPHAVR